MDDDAVSYSDWLQSYPMLGSLTNVMDDAESDGLNNLGEYALGGNPTTNDVAAIMPVSHMDESWFYCVYNKRGNAASIGLTYKVLTGTNLVESVTNEVPEYGTSPLRDDGFVTATNRISTDTDNQAFMHLKVQLD